MIGPLRIQGLCDGSVDLGLVLDEIPVGLVLLDPVRRVRMINRSLQALTGFPREDAGGIPCYHVLRSRLCITGCPLADMRDGSGALCAESDLISRDRQRIPVRITLAALRGAGGKIIV